MSDVLVVFGSGSDKAVYSKVMSGLKAKGVGAELHICSAHRTPQALDKMVAASDAKIIIAGAGLSAALPGAIAAKTARPVIGIPVAANYAGLDALLSTVQMPYGFPVIATGVDGAGQAVDAVQLALQEHSIIKITGNKYNETVKGKIDRLEPIANRLGVQFEFLEKLDEKSFDQKQEILINVVELAGFSPTGLKKALVLNVPVLKESSTPEALELFEKSKQGLWIGLNRVDNALLAAAQLLDVGKEKIGRKIAAIRKELAEKTAEADNAGEKIRVSKNGKRKGFATEKGRGREIEWEA